MSGQQQQENDVYAVVVGGVIAGLRRRHEMTQTDLARAAGITQSTLSRIERGQALPDAFSMRRFAEAYGMTSDQLSREVERAYQETEKATRELVDVDAATPWWKTALKVAGIVGIAGVAAFVIAKILAEEKKT